MNMDPGATFPRAETDRRIDIEIGAQGSTARAKTLGASSFGPTGGRNAGAALDGGATGDAQGDVTCEVKLSEMKGDPISSSQEEKRRSQLAAMPARTPAGRARAKGPPGASKKLSLKVKPSTETQASERG